MRTRKLRHRNKNLSFSLEFTATFTCDNEMEMFADGQSLGKDSDWTNPTTYLVPGNTRVLSVAGEDYGGTRGILGSTSNGQVTNETADCHYTKKLVRLNLIMSVEVKRSLLRAHLFIICIISLSHSK